MKSFLAAFVTLFLIVSTVPIIQEQQAILNDDLPFGNAGRFYIPSVDISVRLYSVASHHDGENAQKYTDWHDSAAYCASFDGGCGYIADHWNQGFLDIRDCEIGCRAYIETENGIQAYKCVKNTLGHNRQTYLETNEGESLAQIDWADICCYTCRNGWEDIYMVFFKKIADETFDFE